MGSPTDPKESEGRQIMSFQATDRTKRINPRMAVSEVYMMVIP